MVRVCEALWVKGDIPSTTPFMKLTVQLGVKYEVHGQGPGFLGMLSLYTTSLESSEIT